MQSKRRIEHRKENDNDDDEDDSEVNGYVAWIKKGYERNDGNEGWDRERACGLHFIVETDDKSDFVSNK